MTSRRPQPRADAGRAPMGTRLVPREVREREMVAVARALFSERGYDDVSMEEIASGAGVSKPLVYAYFGSKEALFLACVDDATHELMHALEEATPPSLPPDVRLWQGLLAAFRFAAESPRSWAMLHPGGGARDGRQAAGAARAHEAMTGLITRLLCDAAVAGGVDREVARQATEPMAHALVAAVQALAAWWRRHPEEPPERVALRMMNFAWMGLDDLLAGRLWLPPGDGDAGPSAPVRSIGAAERAERLARALAEDREATLENVFARMVERYDPPRAGDLDAVVEWRVTGRAGGGHDRFQLHLGPAGCTLVRDGNGSPAATFTIEPDDLAQLVSGATHGGALFTSGRLQVDGDLVLAARVPGFFTRR